MDPSDAVNFARTNQWSVLTTIRGSGDRSCLTSATSSLLTG